MVDLVKNGQTMTSLQIAEVTGKQHKDVIRAIRKMEPAWVSALGRKFALQFRINKLATGGECKIPYYELTKTECLYIATKFNDEARARLILRWEELEKELLSGAQQLAKAEVLPPPIENQRVTPQLVEMVDGKAVTTSRKLAQILGRAHDSVIRTIKGNLYRKAFRYGNFVKRGRSDLGGGNSYEFLITQRGLQALASLMRIKYREQIAEAYKGAWRINAKALSPVSEPELLAALPPVSEPEPSANQPLTSASPQKCLPGLEAEVAEVSDFVEDVKEVEVADVADFVEDVKDVEAEESGEIQYTPEQQKYVDWLEGFNEEAVDRMRKSQATMRMYVEMYEDERRGRKLEASRAAYWHDLYEDIMLRLLNADNVDELLEKHNAFKKRISKK